MISNQQEVTSSHTIDGCWFPKEENWEEELPFNLLLKVKTPPPFIGVGHLKSVDDCENSIAERAGSLNLDDAPDMLDFIEAASRETSTLSHQKAINNCPAAAKDLLICCLRWQQEACKHQVIQEVN
jgi:hypothetical protein